MIGRHACQCLIYRYVCDPLFHINVNIKPTNGEPELWLLAINVTGPLADKIGITLYLKSIYFHVRFLKSFPVVVLLSVFKFIHATCELF